jgi:hypothetical protein
MRRCNGAVGVAAAAALSITAVAAASRTEERGSAEIEPIVEYWILGHNTRTEVFTIGGTYGYRVGAWMPYAGGAIGFFGLHARAGVAFMPGNLEEPSFVIRMEARPQIFYNPCIEPAVLGTFGPGWRWPMEAGDPSNPATAFYLLGNFISGAGWVHDNCGKATEKSLAGAVVVGTSLTAGFDW